MITQIFLKYNMDMDEKKTIEEEFISTLSHEIRTPLTSIKGFSQTMLGAWDKINDDKKKEFLKIILEQSQRLINLVENVLNVAKLDGSSTNLILSKVDLAELIKNCINIISINHKDFVFNFSSSQNDLCSLSDSDKTQQIIINILDNAVKYSKNSNKIDIALSNKITEKGEFCAISIKNYGSYIEKEDYEKIFEKFYRIESYVKSSTQGSGLGLYIAKNLADKMQGGIKVNSSKEENFCEMNIFLPVYNVEKMTKKINPNNGAKNIV